jgi:hypothetical protein
MQPPQAAQAGLHSLLTKSGSEAIKLHTPIRTAACCAVHNAHAECWACTPQHTAKGPILPPLLLPKQQATTQWEPSHQPADIVLPGTFTGTTLWHTPQEPRYAGCDATEPTAISRSLLALHTTDRARRTLCNPACKVVHQCLHETPGQAPEPLFRDQQ